MINIICHKKIYQAIDNSHSTDPYNLLVLATLDHDIDPDRPHILYPAPIHIGRKVWIGAGVIITKGVTIGDNSIVAAGAVVTHDIPSNVIAAGVPARILREI